MEKFYLTTAIDYVNGAPHIGHAYEKILSDIITRHYTQRCDDVYMLTGTDEHGIKIQKRQQARVLARKNFVIQTHKNLKMLGKLLISTIHSLSELLTKITKK